MTNHFEDKHCTLDADDTCTVCGVYHGDACDACGGRGFHDGLCWLVEARAAAEQRDRDQAAYERYCDDRIDQMRDDAHDQEREACACTGGDT